MTDLSDRALLHGDAWHATAAELRHSDPVHFCGASRYGPYWSVLRHTDIRRVEADPGVFSSEVGGVLLDDRRPGTLGCDFMSADPPHHAAQRRSVQPAITPRTVAGYESLIRDWVQDILYRLPGESFDWVDRVATEMASRTLALLFDFPQSDRHLLVRWSEALTAPYTGTGNANPTARAREIRQCVARFRDLWRERARQPPGLDLISRLAHGESTRRMIERPAELLGNLSLLLVGAYDTTRHSLTGGALAMSRHPGEYEKLRNQPCLLDTAVDEIIRWQTPLIYMRRTATADVRVAARQIRRGDKVVLWYLSANYDDSVFDEPRRFLIDRANAGAHLAFGHGIHRCMGRQLARLQLRILWSEVAQRFRGLEIAGQPVPAGGNILRGYEHLPVRVIR